MLTTINKYANVDDILFDNEVKMITKRFSKKIDSKQFEKQFSNGDIETDVIFNIVHDEKKIVKNKSLQQYHHLSCRNQYKKYKTPSFRWGISIFTCSLSLFL